MILQRTWPSTKPSAGATINYGLLGPSVYGAWLFNELGGAPSDLYTREQATGIVGMTWGATQTGVGIRHSSINDTTILRTSNSGNGGLPTNEMTMFMGYEKTDATLRVASPVSSGVLAGVSWLNVHTPYSNGTVYFDFAGNTEAATRISVAGLTTSGQQTWCFSTGPRGMQIWQNGRLRASNSANPIRTNNGGALAAGGSGISDLSIMRFLVILNKQLSPDMITNISANPYMLFGRQSPSPLVFNTAVATPITGLGRRYALRPQ
jgi:hypothetical protein